MYLLKQALDKIVLICKDFFCCSMFACQLYLIQINILGDWWHMKSNFVYVNNTLQIKIAIIVNFVSFYIITLFQMSSGLIEINSLYTKSCMLENKIFLYHRNTVCLIT